MVAPVARSRRSTWSWTSTMRTKPIHDPRSERPGQGTTKSALAPQQREAEFFGYGTESAVVVGHHKAERSSEVELLLLVRGARSPWQLLCRMLGYAAIAPGSGRCHTSSPRPAPPKLCRHRCLAVRLAACCFPHASRGRMFRHGCSTARRCSSPLDERGSACRPQPFQAGAGSHG